MRNVTTLFILLVSFMFATATFAGSKQYGLKSIAGKDTSLEEHLGKGKWKVVILWASDCHACNQEAEQYIQFHEENKDKNIEVLGISLDGAAKLDDAKDFIKRHDVTFPNLIGEFEQVAAMYESLTGGQWLGTPTILIYSPEGELKAAQPGAVPVSLIEEFINSQSIATSTE
ncbi:hypothetical protein MNBD_GAMMA21-962 [hydrothermal vent metagenome]|uniref:Thioredoxin domain-containing protein n=1 Tax=hydrothermal vent metagenome TaxID=652676 RepID=A0A3B0ZIN5_9ZZZZ